MIRIKKLKKNPGIFVKDNSVFEFDKYKEFIEEVLLKQLLTLSNIPTSLLIKLVDNLSNTNILIEKEKTKPERFGVFLNLSFFDDTYGRNRNFTYSLLIFESISLFEKTYVYVPLTNNEYYDSIMREKNIHLIIKEIYPLFIENFVKLCKNRLKLTSQEITELKEILKEKFKKVIR